MCSSTPVISSINDSQVREASLLQLSTNSVYLPDRLSFQFVELTWNLTATTTNQLDWIGLFEKDECNPLLYLDYRSFGVFGQKEGSVKWKINQSSMPPLSKKAELRFRYYSGLTGTVQATSDPFTVFTNGQAVIDSITCKNIKPSKTAYFVKIYYGNETVHKTDLSNNGKWTNLNFHFAADISQELLFVVKERIWSGNRVIGESNIKIAEMVHKNGELAFVLRTRNGVQFNTQISIKCHFMPAEDDSSSKMNTKRLSAKNNDVLNGNSPAMIASTSSSLYSNGNTDCNSLDSITKLPKGWEIRIDKYGRLIYIDHINKKTTWNAPTLLVLEREHDTNARRTVVGSTNNNNNNNNTNQLTKPSQHVLSFLQHSDFPTLLHQNQAALKIYNESAYLKHIISRFRKNRANFMDFEKNRELVAFLNLFADTSQPLPSNWEIGRSKDSNNQRLFIDHNNKQITAIDPRLPIRHNKKRARSEPPAPFLDINQNLQWEISHRTEEISERIRHEMPDIAPRICQKLQNISALGESALEYYANDVNFVCAMSALDHQTNNELKITNDFDIKIDYFYNSLQRAGYAQSSEKIRLNLRRSHLLSDAFDKILTADPTSLRKYQLVVNFEGEEGLDYGGVSKEMFYLISHELFNPYYGLFEYPAANTYSVEISPMSKFVENSLKWMELCGRVLGLSLIHRCLIDTFFTKAFYKMLIGASYTLEDLKSMDNQFYNSLKWIRDNPISSDMDLTFSTTTDVGGEIIETELLPGGKTLLVTDHNKEEFVTLMTRFRIERSRIEQMQSLTRGLYSIVPRNYLSIFDENQLESLLSGTLEIDLEDWRQHTEYKGYHKSDIVIKWFWSFAYEMTNQDRLNLLQFVTGTKSLPVQGFKALRGSNGTVKMFMIEKYGSPDSLPRAHTCFNRLDLPSYISRDTLKSKLKLAITESSTYGIE